MTNVTYITYPYIEAHRLNEKTLIIEPLGIELDYEIKVNEHGCEYADFPTIDTDLFLDPTVSLSESERARLTDHFDAVARRLDD